MEQSSAQSGDIQTLYKPRNGRACGGTVIGSEHGFTGCVDTCTGVASGGKALRVPNDSSHPFHCQVKRNVNQQIDYNSTIICPDEDPNGPILPDDGSCQDADIVFYNGKPYKVNPKDQACRDVIDKVLLEEPITDAECKILESMATSEPA